jgi:hypothetical protein
MAQTKALTSSIRTASEEHSEFMAGSAACIWPTADVKTLVTRAMVFVVVLAQPVDVWTTNRALALGLGAEANPVMAAAMEHLGSAWWVPKLMLAIFMLVVLRKARNIPTRTAIFAAAMAGTYVLVTLNNHFTWL